MKKVYGIVVYGIVKRVTLFSLTVLLLNTCSAIPRSWMGTIEIENATPSFGNIVISLDGYPPFTWEIYDNPLFAGTPAAGDTTYDKYFTTSTLPVGEAYYLRVKSTYGEWQIYGADPQNPTLLWTTASANYGTIFQPYIIENKADLIALSDQSTTRYSGEPPWGGRSILHFSCRY